MKASDHSIQSSTQSSASMGAPPRSETQTPSRRRCDIKLKHLYSIAFVTALLCIIVVLAVILNKNTGLSCTFCDGKDSSKVGARPAEMPVTFVNATVGLPQECDRPWDETCIVGKDVASCTCGFTEWSYGPRGWSNMTDESPPPGPTRRATRFGTQ